MGSLGNEEPTLQSQRAEFTDLVNNIKKSNEECIKEITTEHSKKCTDAVNELTEHCDSIRVKLEEAMSNVHKLFSQQSETIQKNLNESVNQMNKDYTEQCVKLNNLLSSINKHVTDKVDNVVTQSNEWNEIKEKLSQASLTGLVKLNVGGKVFQTSVDTLTKEKNTFFTALFSKQWTLEKDDSGSVFIDRNGDLFTHILDYLRSGQVILPKDEHVYKRLLIEVEFYQLKELHQKLVDLKKETQKKDQEQ